MKKWLKRIRGAIGMGLSWAAAWAGVGAIVALVGLVFAGAGPVAMATAVVGFAVAGFIGGAAFSVVLGIAEGRRRFDQMSLPRFVAWGAVGGLLLFMLWGGGAGETIMGKALMASMMTLLGAGSAAGSLALARRANPSLESGEDVGLLEGESDQ